MLPVVAFHGSEARAEEAINVTVTTARSGALIDTLLLTGTVTAEQNASLSPRVSGLVAAVSVDAGNRVKAGDVLVELDATLSKLALAQLDAGIAEAQARLDESQRQRNEAERLARTRSVAATQVEASAATVRIDTAAVARLQAQRREQAEVVARHALVAPFDGVVSMKHTEAGEWIETGDPAVDLVAVDRLRIDVHVPQERYYDLVDDTPVEVRLDALPDRRFTGRILTRVPVKDTGARAFLVRVVLDGVGAGLMTPGMSAQTAFGIRTASSALLLPRDALVRRPDGSVSVWVIEEVDGTARVQERPVRIGLDSGNQVEIASGIDAGTRVVVQGNEVLRNGQVVRIVGEDTPAAGAQR